MMRINRNAEWPHGVCCSYRQLHVLTTRCSYTQTFGSLGQLPVFRRWAPTRHLRRSYQTWVCTLSPRHARVLLLECSQVCIKSIKIYIRHAAWRCACLSVYMHSPWQISISMHSHFHFYVYTFTIVELHAFFLQMRTTCCSCARAGNWVWGLTRSWELLISSHPTCLSGLSN